MLLETKSFLKLEAKRMILGVSGPYASGKGEVVAFLKERSFVAYSLSDLIRRELADQGLEETRERMIETGNGRRVVELKVSGGNSHIFPDLSIKEWK